MVGNEPSELKLVIAESEFSGTNFESKFKHLILLPRYPSLH